MSKPYKWAPKSILRKRVIKLSLIQISYLYENDMLNINEIIEFVVDVNEIFNVTIKKEDIKVLTDELLSMTAKIDEYIDSSFNANLLKHIARVAIFYIYRDKTKKDIIIKEFLFITEALGLEEYCAMIHKLIDKA